VTFIYCALCFVGHISLLVDLVALTPPAGQSGKQDASCIAPFDLHIRFPGASIPAKEWAG